MELPPATAGGESTAVAAAIELRAARRGAAAEQALWMWRCARASWSGGSGTTMRSTAGCRAGGRPASTTTGRRRCGSACCTPATST
eukprot:1311041-Prymnesium_polylepis.1